MTRERARELEANGVLPAWREGRKIQVQVGNGMPWEDYRVGCPNFSCANWRVAPEPKLRPWRLEEVPVGAVLRTKTLNSRWLLSGINNVGEIFIAEDDRWRTAEYLLHEYKHSLDNGKTWHPCGVMEGGE